MEFQKLSRDANLLVSGQWRLASVEEVKSNLEVIKNKGILGTWDIARLLAGWVMGPGYKYEYHQGYKSGMSYMVLVRTNVSRPPDGSFIPEMYSGVQLNDQGRKAALLLSCDVKITEVIYFVLHKFKEVKDRKTELEILIVKIKKDFGKEIKAMVFLGL